MLIARKKIMALTLMATLGTAVFAQVDALAIAAGVWVVEGIDALLNLRVDLVVAGVKGGKTVKEGNAIMYQYSITKDSVGR